MTQGGWGSRPAPRTVAPLLVGVASVGILGVGGGDINNVCRRQNVVVSATKHAGREALHDRACLHDEIAQEGSGFPTADQANAISVNASIEERLSAGGTQMYTRTLMSSVSGAPASG